MRKLTYLIISILCAAFSHEILAVSDNELSSFVPHIRQKRMDPSPNLNHLVNMEDPTRVDIITKDNLIRPGFAIHHLFVITRPEYVQGSFRITLTVEHRVETYPEGYSSLFIDHSKDVAVVKVTKPISFTRPELHALENRKFSEAGILYALDIVQEWMQHSGYKMQVIGQKWQEAAASIVSQSLKERTNQNHPRCLSMDGPPGDIGRVEIKEPTRVDIISPGKPPQPGFAINTFHVITRPEYVRRNPIRVKLTVGHASMERRQHITYVNQNDDIAVIKLEYAIYLSRPELNAFYYHDYSKAAIDYAVTLLEWWLKKNRYTMQLTVSGRKADSAASGSRSGLQIDSFSKLTL